MKYIEVYNNDNKISVSDNFRNFALLEKITPSLSQDMQIVGYTGNLLKFESKTYSNPVMAFFSNTSNEPIVVRSSLLSISGSGFSIVGYLSCDIKKISTKDIKIYIYGLKEDQQDISKYGLEIFDNQGIKIFDSDWRFLNIKDVVEYFNDEVVVARYGGPAPKNKNIKRLKIYNYQFDPYIRNGPGSGYVYNWSSGELWGLNFGVNDNNIAFAPINGAFYWSYKFGVTKGIMIIGKHNSYIASYGIARGDSRRRTIGGNLFAHGKWELRYGQYDSHLAIVAKV